MNEQVVKNGLSIHEAEMIILSIRDQIAPMGANDFEIPTLNRLLGRLKKGQCSAQDAVREAQKILDHKGAYH